MNFGPLEFAAWLRRRDSRPPSKVAGASQENRLSVISGPVALTTRETREAGPCRVFEAIALGDAHETGARMRVAVQGTLSPVVLVLSACHSVCWQVERTPEARVLAVLTAGAGDSLVSGADDLPSSVIPGFYAFRHGSPEFLHLEAEVMRVTGRVIGQFQAAYSTRDFVVGGTWLSEL
jgi:hypothetical protein